jgi:hypothetical protein
MTMSDVPPPNAPTPHELAAAGRIVRMIRDLRRQREAWSEGEVDFGNKLSLENSDVARFNCEAVELGLNRHPDDLLIAVVAAIVAEERERGKFVDDDQVGEDDEGGDQS